MKKINLLAFVLLSFLPLAANAQTIKVYTGKIESPKKIPLSGRAAQITYHYYQGDNTRIWHGDFSLKKIEDDFGYNNGTIVGSFQDGQKVGTWKFTERMCNADTRNKNVVVNFNDDKLNGHFSIIDDWVDLQGTFADDHLIDTLYIDYRSKKYVKATRPAKYVYSVIAHARLIFDEKGFSDGYWVFTNITVR